MSEYKNLNIINVPYGFCWTHRKKDGSVSGSTYTIDHYLELADKKLETAQKEIKNLKAQLEREKACVDFYADKDNWADATGRGSHFIESSNTDIEERWCGERDGPLFLGGKLARETQAKRND